VRLFVRSFNFFSRLSRVRSGGGVRFSLSLSLGRAAAAAAAALEREGRELREFPIGKNRKKARSRGEKKIKAAKARESLFLSPESSPEDAKMRRRRERAFFFLGGGLFARQFSFIAQFLSLSLSLSYRSLTHLFFSVFCFFFSLLQAWLNSRTRTARKP